MLLNNVVNSKAKIILITGPENVNKGIETGSFGVLAKANGYSVTVIKMDSCLNYDAATLSQSRYGEPYVTDDGEIGLFNIGNIQRFTNQKFTKKHNLTIGKINHVIKCNEKKGMYNGNKIFEEQAKTSTIIEWIKDVCKLPNICIIELCGDIEKFSEPLKYFKYHAKTEFMHIHISRITRNDSASILKGVHSLRDKGWPADMIICKSGHEISENVKDEIAQFSPLERHKVINLLETENINQVPLLLQQQNVYSIIAKKLKLEHRPNINNVMQKWSDIVRMTDCCKNTVKIALVGKYFKPEFPDDPIYRDSYASVINALNDAGLHENCKVQTVFVLAVDLEAVSPYAKQSAAFKKLEESHGIVITAGFKLLGFRGMMQACKYAREKNKPLLSICNGMQSAIIEFAQNVLGIDGAWSTKLWDEQSDERRRNQLEPLPPLKPEQQVVIRMFENIDGQREMRLGRRTTTFLTEDSKLFELYGKKDSIQERHRHGYEINPELVQKFIDAGLYFVGLGVDERTDCEEKDLPESSKYLLEIARNKEMNYLQKVNTLCEYHISIGTSVRMEMMELTNHPYFVGVQFHPEFQSRPLSPSPPFVGLVQASFQYSS